MSLYKFSGRLRYLSTQGQQLKCASNGIISTRHSGNSADDQMKEFWAKNQKLNRPNSPWFIYEWKLPMMTSLMTRISGAYLTGVVYAGSIGLLACGCSVDGTVAAIQAAQLPVACWFTAKTAIALPFTYHTANGLRHLTWDSGRGYEMKTQYQTGKLAIVGSVVAAMALAAL